MRHLCVTAAVLLTMVAVLMTSATRATVRDGFFDTGRRPSVLFDKRRMTWTLRNQAVERVLQFDQTVGALRTTALTDVKRRWTIRPPDGFEGGLNFEAPIISRPTLLSSLRTATAPPPAAWAKPDFDDSDWVTYERGGQAKERWLRGRVPGDLLKEGQNWALLLEKAVTGRTEIFFDGTLAQTLTVADHPEARLVQVVIPLGTRTIALHLQPASAPAELTGSLSIAQAGSSPTNLDLSRDWKYLLHSVNANEDGSLILSITLNGIKGHEGFDLDVFYQIFPGEQPYLVKWFTFTSHRSSRYRLDEVVFDRFALPGGLNGARRFGAAAIAASDPQTSAGLFSGVLSEAGMQELGEDGKTLSVLDRPGCLIKPNTPQDTARSVLSPYSGTTAVGAFLYQLYISRYIARATPQSVPTAYNTWYGYGDAISAATCERIAPLAAELGAKLFVIDHGWETNASPNSGAVGDWLTDRSPHKFPKGLLPVSLLVRENGMRFGLWTSPTAASDRSEAATQHGSWLLRGPDGDPVPAFNGASRMCFSSGWADNYTDTLRDLARDMAVSYFKVDGKLFHDFCCDPAHNHPVGRAQAAQSEYWERFAEQLRKVTPGLLIDRSTETGAEATAVQDEGVCFDWMAPADPKKPATSDDWRRSADRCRSTLYDLVWTRPSFTLECTAPCRLAGSDLETHEYCLTSAAAYVCNLELQGNLDDMTPKERAMVQKWVRWNERNRAWLAYSQPILDRPSAGTAAGHVDGVLHLRPALEGRYGYICLWNPAPIAQTVEVAFRPSDYLVQMGAQVELTSVTDGKTSAVSLQNGRLALESIMMPPHSWQIFEIRQPSARR